MNRSNPTRIMLIGGSLAAPSHTNCLLGTAVAVLTKQDVSTNLWRVSDHPLAIADPAFYRDPYAHPDPQVHALAEQAEAANAFIVASPTYHNSYSAAVKNIIDHLDEEFDGKPVALLTNCGGTKSTHALDHMRISFRSLGAIVIPGQMTTDDSDFERHGDEYALTSPSMMERLTDVCRELQWFARQFHGASEELCA